MNCNPTRLATLIEQSNDPSDSLGGLAEHIEHCDRCREELRRLGGDRQSWVDVRESLLHQSRDQQIDGRANDSIDLNFLPPSVQPEMLGRLGRYEIEGLIGRGGTGIVFRGHDTELHQSVAVKVLAPHLAASPVARQRFAREAKAAASITHPNVVAIHNVQADAPMPFMAMQYVDGMTLQRLVTTNGALEIASIFRVTGQLLDGLAAAHARGLVHRDIKPANILVGQNTDRIWLTDFGLAYVADATVLTGTGVIAGTPQYMSPEQVRGEPLDQRSDLFSLGSVLYFLCSGRCPFNAENTLAVLHQIVTTEPVSLRTLRPRLARRSVSVGRKTDAASTGSSSVGLS